jgi:hypothetical protein
MAFERATKEVPRSVQALLDDLPRLDYLTIKVLALQGKLDPARWPALFSSSFFALALFVMRLGVRAAPTAPLTHSLTSSAKQVCIISRDFAVSGGLAVRLVRTTRTYCTSFSLSQLKEDLCDGRTNMRAHTHKEVRYL